MSILSLSMWFLLASSVQQSLGILLNPIFSPLIQSNTSSEQGSFFPKKRRYTDSSNESSSSKPQYISSDVATVFANQIVHNPTNSSTLKSPISTCHLCGKKFQSNEYLQLHLMNKHQMKSDLPQQQRTIKMSNLISTSNDSLNNNQNIIKKIKLEPNETTAVTKASSPVSAIASPSSSTVMPGIVDTYFAAKLADRVSCDICHKVRLHCSVIIHSLFVSSKYVINISSKLINSKFMVLELIPRSLHRITLKTKLIHSSSSNRMMLVHLD